YVTAVALGQYVLAERTDGGAGQHLAADGGLYRHGEHLAGNDLRHAVDHLAAQLVRLVNVGDDRQRVHALLVHQDIDAHELAGTVTDRFIIHAGVTAGHALEPVVEIVKDLGKRHFVP